MKQNYVPITLDQYLNESKTITLKRGYGERKPVVVGSNAPIRNQILAYVAENQSVSKGDLKRFIAGLNEGSRNPNASAIMWLKRNSQFFVMESKAGQTFFKLSPVGLRLTSRFVPPMGAPVSLTEKKKEKKDDFDFVDTKKGYPRKGLNDCSEEEDDENCPECKKPMDECTCGDDKKKTNESKEEARKERIKAIIENIRSKRAKPEEEKPINEAEKPAEKPAEEADELSFDDLDLEGEDKGEEKPEGGGLDLGDDKKEDENTEKVEITEFIITVDNADEAIKELEELGIPAEKVEDEETHDEETETPEEEKTETPETEEKEKVEGTEKPVEEAEEPDLDLGGDEPTEEPDLDLGGDEEKPAHEEKIKVSVDHWEELKGWLEGKGIDVAEMFGGEVEVEEEPAEGEKKEGDDLDLGDDLEGGDELNLDDEPELEEATEGPMDVIDEPAQSLGDRIADKIADKIIAKL